MQHKESECGKDETFVGNTLLSEWKPARYKKLKTARIGEQAYDIYGKKIPKDYMRPLFIGNSELGLYDEIMMERLRMK